MGAPFEVLQIIKFFVCFSVAIQRIFGNVWELAFVALGGLFFWVLDPFILKGYNFLDFIPFLMIFNAPNEPIGEV